MTPPGPTVARSAGRRLLGSGWACWGLLVLSVAAHVAVSALTANPFGLIDLQVYLDGARHLGSLYSVLSGTQQLPFTYPPFAALLFVPLALLPWPLVVALWEAGSIAAIAGIVYCSLRLAGRAGPRATRPLGCVRGLVLVGTAAGIWLDPVRGTLNYGQVNLFLALLLLAGAVAGREWLAGVSVGIAAGIKLVPAITGLYYLAGRRWRAVAVSVGVFAATVGLAAAVLPTATWRYFTDLIVDPGRTGELWHTRNQSLRGAIYRLLGHDSLTIWLVTALVCLAIGAWAVRVAWRGGDRLGAFLAAQFTGLLISPVSWWHHWVWVLPLLLWCCVGPRAARVSVRALGWCWAVVCFGYVASVLIAVQNSHLASGASRPLAVSLADTVYVVLGIATLAVIAAGRIMVPKPETASTSGGIRE